MKHWWQSVKVMIRRKYYLYKFKSHIYRLLISLKLLILKLKLKLLIYKLQILMNNLLLWRHFPFASGLLAGVIYCSFVGFEYLPSCIMGIGFVMWYDYYKHPDISKLKSCFALSLLILAYIIITIIHFSWKLGQ